jgi:microcystin-dependent protein
LIGTTYGGDGVNTFDLPDLNGRTAADADDGTGLNGLTPFSLGEKTGVENVTLSASQIPPVPEPAYFAPLAIGAIALIARRRASSIP